MYGRGTEALRVCLCALCSMCVCVYVCLYMCVRAREPACVKTTKQQAKQKGSLVASVANVLSQDSAQYVPRQHYHT